MKILHDGAESSPHGINGVNATVWLMAEHQSRLGHRVGMLFREQPCAAALAIAQRAGIDLIAPPGETWLGTEARVRSAFHGEPPDIVHMHSVFIPSQALLGRELLRCGIPYVVTPHGGLSPQILNRGRFKKSLYVRLVEKPRCAGAAALTASLGEEREISAFLGSCATPIRRLPIPVNGERLGVKTWQGNISAKRFVFLGRFDVYVKGIDRLIDLAGLMRDHEFHLYGNEDARTRQWLHELRIWCPPNVFFHPPVFGEEKIRVLTEASMYIQMSRSESFGISIAEAMYLGVPCAISEEINLADTFLEHDLGITLPSSPGFAAYQLTGALKSSDSLTRWSRRGRRFARHHFEAAQAVSRYLNLYRELLGNAETGQIPEEELAFDAVAG